MPDDTYDRLTPAQIIATFQSLPRRFKGELFGDPSIDVNELAHQQVAGGASPIGLVATATSAIDHFGRAAYRAAVLDNPAVPAMPTPTPGASLNDALTALDRTIAERVAELQGLPTSGWSRRASAAGLGERTAIELAQEAVRRSIGALRSLDAVMRQLVPHRQLKD